MTRNTVLIVEDEDEIRDMLSFSLTRAGYSVVSAADAEEALQSLDGPLPDLIIIDWMLPGMSGIDLARIMRNDAVTGDLPMIMLTAKGEEVDKLKSFEAGVDDYVTKPFSPRELIARVKAILRRSGAPEEGVLVAERLKLDTRARRLSVDGDEVRIGPTEFRLLEFLMRHPERVFDREQLLDRVWGRTVYIEERTVDVHVLRLRKILAPFGLDNFIQTVRGVGYRFSTTV